MKNAIREYDVVDDPILEKILTLFDGKVGEGFDEEEMKKIIIERSKRKRRNSIVGLEKSISCRKCQMI